LGSIESDGIILRDVEKVDEALACGVPTVFIGHQQAEIPGLVNVVTDSEAIARMGAEHLIGCGFKHFAFCGYKGAPWSEARMKFFSERICAAGFDKPEQFELPMAREDWAKGQREMACWLQSLRKPIGLMACNDDCGGQVMEASKLAGIQVPDALGIIGADNDEVVCGITGPPMSSIAINFERAGYEVAQVLHKMMRGVQTDLRTIRVSASHVVARRSTDFVAVEEGSVAKALRYIRDHARDTLSVNQVAQAAGLSRRALEKRFRTMLGRSILEEVRRVRTDQIARLLLETDLPVSEIANVMGFADAQHIARYFRSGKCLSPIAYRKVHGMRDVVPRRSQNGDSYPQSGVVRGKARRV